MIIDLLLTPKIPFPIVLLKNNYNKNEIIKINVIIIMILISHRFDCVKSHLEVLTKDNFIKYETEIMFKFNNPEGGRYMPLYIVML